MELLGVTLRARACFGTCENLLAFIMAFEIQGTNSLQDYINATSLWLLLSSTEMNVSFDGFQLTLDNESQEIFNLFSVVHVVAISSRHINFISDMQEQDTETRRLTIHIYSSGVNSVPESLSSM